MNGKRKLFADFPLTFSKPAHIIAPSTARALRQGSRSALFAFLRRLTHPIRMKSDEGEKYRGGSATESGGRWKPRAGDCGKNTPELQTERFGKYGRRGRPLYRNGLSEPEKWSSFHGGKLGGTAERSIRPNPEEVLPLFDTTKGREAEGEKQLQHYPEVYFYYVCNHGLYQEIPEPGGNRSLL